MSSNITPRPLSRQEEKAFEAEAKKRIQEENDFITLYTDASYCHKTRRATIAWRGKCRLGVVHGDQCLTDVQNIQVAEMLAIREGIKDALRSYPNLIGVFINSDSLDCVHALWPFKPTPKWAMELVQEIQKILGTRWIRTKHVKAHTGNKDVRSYMNHAVDRQTKQAWNGHRETATRR